jgi:hypothetical protein
MRLEWPGSRRVRMRQQAEESFERTPYKV